jgi:hypothetical protein
MSRAKSLRLAQFFRVRLDPLLNNMPSTPEQRKLFALEFFEAAGWLNEGVFCGYFDTGEADIVWVQLDPLRQICGMPEPPLVNPKLASEIGRLYSSNEPFRGHLQMTEGPQKRYELPLFPYALLLGDRFYADRLATDTAFSISLTSKNQWAQNKESWHLVDPSLVSAALAGGQPLEVGDQNSLLAGHLRIMEHLEASRRFFDYAKGIAGKKHDFDSYCQRIGGLNGWRVPLSDSTFASRFSKLSDLVEFALRPLITQELPGAMWSTFEDSFSRHREALVRAWEMHHLSALLQDA